MKSSTMTLFVFLALSLWTRPAAADVPAKYAQLYKALSDDLDAAEAWLYRQGPERRHDTVFMTELLNANCNRGSELLHPDTLASCAQALDRLREIGVRGVKISIHYPMLLPIWNTKYPQQPNTAYIEFYKKVSEEVHQRGMSLTIQIGTFFPQPGVSHDGWNYQGMTVEQFAQGLTQQAQVIIREIKPEYLNILSEPTTQEHNTGLKLDPETYLHVIQTAVRGCPRSATKLAAGAGTWNKPEYFDLLAAQTSLDILDMHVYPIADGELTTRVAHVDDLCRQYHKEIAMSECWLYKSASAQPTQNPNVEQATCDWSFWEPLDERFVRCVVSISRLYGLRYCSFFSGEDHFLANVQYGPDTANLTPEQVKALEDKAVSAALRADTFDELGVDFAQIVR